MCVYKEVINWSYTPTNRQTSKRHYTTTNTILRNNFKFDIAHMIIYEVIVTEMLCSIYTKFTKVTSDVVHPMYNTFSSLSMSTTLVYVN